MKDATGLTFRTSHTYTVTTREFGFTKLAEFADNYDDPFRPDTVTVEWRDHRWGHPDAPPVTSTERDVTISGPRILSGNRPGKKRVSYTWHSWWHPSSQLDMPPEVAGAVARISAEAGRPV